MVPLLQETVIWVIASRILNQKYHNHILSEKKRSATNKVKAYTKYSGLAYQLVGLLGVSIWLGLKADAHLGNERQYITALACILVLFAFFYKVYITVSSEK